MARETIVKLIDDLDGSEASETVEFGLDGITYSIDVSGKNGQKLRTALAPFIEKAERVRSGKVVNIKTATGNGSIRKHSDAQEKELRTLARAWAAKHDVTVPERGRMAQEVMDAYNVQDVDALKAWDAKRNGKPVPVAVVATKEDKAVLQGQGKTIAAAFSDAVVGKVTKRAPRKVAAKAVTAAG